MTCRACGYSNANTFIRYVPTSEKTSILDGDTGGYLKPVCMEEPIKDSEPFVHVGSFERKEPSGSYGGMFPKIIMTELFACPKCGTVRAEAQL